MLTEAPRFLPAPVGGAGIPAGQHAEALQPVTRQAGEEGLAAGVEPANGHVAVGGPPRENAAQHESWKKTRKDRYGRQQLLIFVIIRHEKDKCVNVCSRKCQQTHCEVT